MADFDSGARVSFSASRTGEITREAVAADGRVPRNIGLGIVATSVLASSAVIASLPRGDDSGNWYLGGPLFSFTAPAALPFLAYGLWVGSPEE